jgi:hypothetical protein
MCSIASKIVREIVCMIACLIAALIVWPVSSGVVMPARRPATPRLPRPVLEYGRLRFQSTKILFAWTLFVAGLWSLGRVRRRLILSLPRLFRRSAVAAMLLALPGCGEIALSNNAMPRGSEPLYVPLAAKYLQSVLKDARSYDGFEISGPRWVTTLRGWSWLACVRYHDHGRTRIYAIFIQDGEVSDGRYAVETDGCEAQTYTQFDLISGELGKPTAPVQQPLY